MRQAATTVTEAADALRRQADKDKADAARRNLLYSLLNSREYAPYLSGEDISSRYIGYLEEDCPP